MYYIILCIVYNIILVKIPLLFLLILECLISGMNKITQLISKNAGKAMTKEQGTRILG